MGIMSIKASEIYFPEMISWVSRCPIYILPCLPSALFHWFGLLCTDTLSNLPATFLDCKAFLQDLESRSSKQRNKESVDDKPSSMCYDKQHFYACGCEGGRTFHCIHNKTSRECPPQSTNISRSSDTCRPCELDRSRRVEEIVDEGDVDELIKLMNSKL